jgi:tripartite-type tricarboxylate transporter receptor subunit TctC
MLKAMSGTYVVHVAYRGMGPAVTDLAGNQVQLLIGSGPSLMPHVRSGRLRALAVSSVQRLAVLPDVPTVAESGWPGFEADQWYGLVAPAGTPAAWVARLNTLVNQALAAPEVAPQLAAEGALPMPGTPQDFGALVTKEIPRWADVVRKGNVRPD